MMSHLSTLLLVGFCLVLLTGMFAQEQEQEGELGSTAILQCQKKTGFRDCTWSLDDDLNLILKSTFPDEYPPGYSLNFDSKAGTCTLKIDAVKHKDMGKWSCVIDITRTEIKLVVTKRPKENNLKYNEQVVNNGASVGVEPDAEGKVKVVCESKYGLPKAKITWRVDKQDASDKDIIFTEEGGSDTDGFHVKSVLTLKYPTKEKQPTGYARVPEKYPDRQKEVYCTIKYSKDEAKAIELHAIFEEEIETTDAVLEVLPGSNNKERILRCDANGIPEPDYQIVRTEPNPETSAPKAPSRTVTVEGKYVCKAGNRLNVQPYRSNLITVDFGITVEDTTASQPTSVGTTGKDSTGGSDFGNSLLHSASIAIICTLAILSLTFS